MSRWQGYSVRSGAAGTPLAEGLAAGEEKQRSGRVQGSETCLCLRTTRGRVKTQSSGSVSLGGAHGPIPKVPSGAATAAAEGAAL